MLPMFLAYIFLNTFMGHILSEKPYPYRNSIYQKFLEFEKQIFTNINTYAVNLFFFNFYSINIYNQIITREITIK